MNQQAYTQELFAIMESLPENRRGHFAASFSTVEKNPVIMFGLNMWLGWLGIDRSVVGDTLAGVLKLISCLFGVGFIWIIVDYFLIGGRTRNVNIEAARRLKLSIM